MIAPRRPSRSLPSRPLEQLNSADLPLQVVLPMTSEPDLPLVEVYDTTLRDGSQGEGISFTLEDKLRIAERLDAFGVTYIEGGWPGSNPKDVEFFERARDVRWK